jgi:hypothetical protein
VVRGERKHEHHTSPPEGLRSEVLRKVSGAFGVGEQMVEPAGTGMIQGGDVLNSYYISYRPVKSVHSLAWWNWLTAGCRVYVTDAT